ncbi:LysR family transcriptional regulator [Paenibacillus spiritus]|uniref:LysR family transcriptional regulator n=1 Tax=Paenibacillus spiritus TaxID=2496557 RepID=A0A5J5G9C2_9BACL|nr:LysR family transcriptional regulator [Paenibacillus spiritus]KAA9004212.1 LysR family transcriptional regulator [Paenibacillus spiritus]
MELLQLQYFVEVARIGHVTEAANRLHVTQSSLSRTIHRLEEDLGVLLFDRIGRRVRLNANGARFLERAQRALFELEQGRQELSGQSGAASGTLELAVNTASMLPAILGELRGREPSIHFHVQMMPLDEMAACLRRGEADYCLVSPLFEQEDIQCELIHTDPIVLAVPAEHRLAGRSALSLADIGEEELVGVKKGYGTRDLIDSLCRSAGVTPRYIYEGDEPARILDLVEAGIGAAFVPGTARDYRRAVAYIGFENEDLVREIALLRHRGRYLSDAARKFRDVVADYFERSRNGRTNHPEE